MKNSIEKSQNFIVVFGGMAYDEEKEQIECPPSTVNNKKMLPRYRVPMQEGEMAINASAGKFDVDNGKIVKFEDRRKGKETVIYEVDHTNKKVVEFQDRSEEDTYEVG